MPARFSKLILVTLLILSGAGFFTIPSVEAQVANLTVQFENNPLFSESNFLPADFVTRWIKVTNNSGVSQKIATEAINVSNPNSLASAFNLKIKEGTNVIFDNTLAAFFANGETFLSNLATGNQAQYDFTISFANDSNNNFQNKGLGFDILIGFQGEDGNLNLGQTFSTSGGNNGGGGLPLGLTIFNEANLDVQDITATITWQTNYFSTSRVIYSAENEPHNFDYSNPPNYGYAHSTVEDSAKVTAHQVILTGLTPDTLYYYRVISHASPDSISRSVTFKTTGEVLVQLPAETPTLKTPLAPTPPVTKPQPPGGVVAGVEYQQPANNNPPTIQERLALADATDQVSVAETDNQKNTSSQVPTPNCGLTIWLFLILNLAALIVTLVRFKNSSQSLFKNTWVVGVLVIVIPTIVWYSQCWLQIWLIITLIILLLYLAIFWHKN